MDHLLTFADSEFTHKRRQTRKEKFLGRMEKLIPWQRLVAIIPQGRKRTPSLPVDDDAADSLFAVMV
jgi:hypothetical protein